MQYTVPHYYSRFACTADACPDTCCAGWQIVIDRKSLAKYKKVDSPFGNRLKNGIDWKEGVFRQYQRRCEFLNEANLCDIYAEIGPDMLCRTCRNYPRHIEEFEGLREISLSLSCPEAAKIILGLDEPVQFLTKETEKEESYEDFDFLLFTKLCDTRDLLFRILQNRAYPMKLRMAISAALAHDVQIRISRNEMFGIDDILSRYESGRTYAYFEKKLQGFEGRAEERFSLIQEFGRALDYLEVLRPEWSELLKSLRNALYSDGADAYAASRREFAEYLEQREQYLEQLMIFWVFTYFCGAVYDEHAESKMKLALFSTLMILELAHGMWLRQGKRLSFEEFADLAHRYAREIEHSDPNLNTLEEVFQRDKKYHLEQFLICIMN